MELKSFIVRYNGKFIRAYEETEADNVIAKLKAQKAQAEDDCAYWKAKAQRERHHKFKRCLAMARLCHERSLWWYSKGYGFEKYDKFWEKWEKRWLELANQFKPNSSATKENSDG